MRPLLHHRHEYIITHFHQHLRLLVVVEQPPLLVLHQLVRQHPRQTVLLYLLYVLLRQFCTPHQTLLLVHQQPANIRTILYHLVRRLLHFCLLLAIITEVEENGGFFPRKRLAPNPKRPQLIQELV